MKYQGSPGFSHQQADKIGVLICNLGTPEAPTPAALRRYLREFLSDPRVVEVPRLLWWFVLNGIILRVRPRRSAAAYAKVFTDAGSPLLLHTRAQAAALQENLAGKGRDDILVDYAMRYGQPDMSAVMQSMFDKGVRKLLVLPMYPQYSGSTAGSVFDALAQDFLTRRLLPDLRFISHYHDYPPYIDAAAARIREHWEAHGRADKLLFSYHGVPRRYLDNGDPYHCECHKTSRLIAQALGLSAEEYLTTFQSRFGREEWLQPYTDKTLEAFPGQGIRSVQVFCPGFAADCLETLEEIGEENRENFLHAGGERYEYISALNARPDHIEALAGLVLQELQGWAVAPDPAREARARALGAGK